jgi:hypothetical protein
MQDEVLIFLKRQMKEILEGDVNGRLGGKTTRTMIVLNTINNLIEARKIELGIIVLEKECD